MNAFDDEGKVICIIIWLLRETEKANKNMN